MYVYPAGDERLAGSTLHVLSTRKNVAEAATRLPMQLRQRHTWNQDMFICETYVTSST